jgi:hypothetical protein
MLNPLITPDHLLKEFPLINLLICEKDPLHDGGLKFAMRFIKLKKDIELIRCRYLPHGILSMAFPQGMPEAYKFENLNIDLIKKEFQKL